MVAGVYYFTESITDILKVQVADRGPGLSCDNAGVTGTDRCHLDNDNNITDNDSWADFGQSSYDFTNALSGSFGFRYTEETKGSFPDQFDYANPDAKFLPAIQYKEKFSATTVSGSLDYRTSDSTMVYGSYSEGFKGGGWNSTFNFTTTPSDLEAGHMFDQEEVKTFELGLKSDVTDTLRVNAAVFSSDYTDLQFTYRVFIAPWFFNAGKASIDGAEVEFTWLPSDQWIVEGGIGVLDSSIDEAADIDVPGRPINSGVEVGNQLPFAPDLQANLGIGYSVNTGSMEITPRGNLAYSDKVYFDAINTAAIAQLDSYSLVDLPLTFEKFDSNWKAVIGVNNATDEEYRVSGNSSLGSGSGYSEVTYARPRVIFGLVTYDF